MRSLSGFQFLIDRSGQPVFLDYENKISFRRAQGQFVSPDRVAVTARVISPGMVTEVQIISIGGIEWETNYLTGAWQLSDPRYSFNPSRLFDSQNGIPAILAKDLVDPVSTGEQELPEIPGKKLVVVQAQMNGEPAYNMTYGLIDKDTLQIKLWVDPDSFDLYRIRMVDPANSKDQEDTIWQIDFWDFDHTFQIEKPNLQQ